MDADEIRAEDLAYEAWEDSLPDFEPDPYSGTYSEM